MRRLVILFTIISILFCFLNINAYADSLKAYRDIYFKDSPKTVSQKIRNDEEIKTQLFGVNPHVKIGDYRYWLSFEYYQDQLYKVVFKSDSSSASYFNTYTQRYYNTLANTILEKYGPPKYSRKLTILDMDTGFINWGRIWEEEETDSNKIYKIGIGENYEYKYYAVMQIIYKPLQDEKEKAESVNSKSAEDSANDF